MNREEAARILHEIEDKWLEPKTYLHERENKALDIAIDALRSPWVKTADRLPTKVDADSELMIMAWHIYFGYEAVAYGSVMDEPEMFTYWMPIPPLPEVEK